MWHESTPEPRNVTAFGERAFQEAIKLEAIRTQVERNTDSDTQRDDRSVKT